MYTPDLRGKKPIDRAVTSAEQAISVPIDSKAALSVYIARGTILGAE
jgi:hypothetical protein